MKTSLRWPLFLFFALGIALCSQVSDAPTAAKTDSHDIEATALRKKAEQLNEAGEPDSALVYAQKGADFSEKTNNWPEWGKSKVQESLALYYQRKFKEALASLAPLEQKAKANILPADEFWGVYYNCAGIVYNAVGDFETALKYGSQEIAFYEANGNKKLLADAYNNISNSYRSKGDFDRAVDYAQSGLQIFLSDTSFSRLNLAWAYSSLGQIFYRKKDYPQAIAHSQKALEILQRHFSGKEPFEYIIAFNDLANAYGELGEYDKALEALQKALSLHQQHNLERDIEATWHNMGFIYRRMGKYAEAKMYLLRALERYQELYGTKHPNIGKAYRHLGFVAHRQGDLRGALAYYQQSLRTLTDSFPHENVLANPAVQRVNSYLDFLLTLRDKGEALRQLAKKEHNSQFLEASLATYDVAMSLLDTMRAEYQEGSRQFWNREARPIVEGAIGTALELFGSTGNGKFLEQAFRYAEKSKALLLAEALQESAAKQKAGIPEELLQEEKDLKIDIAFYKKQIFREQQKAAPDTSKILLWQKQTLQRRRAYETLLTKLETSFPEYYQIKYSQPTLSMTAVQQALPPDCGLLEYFTGDSANYVFYLDKNGAKGLRLAADALFQKKLEDFVNNLRNREQVLERGRSKDMAVQFASDASHLYQTLTAPVVEKIPQQLIVIPDGNLSYLPFELLLTQNAEQADNYAELPYLLRQTAVRYEYSASLALQPPMPKKARNLFAGYAPEYDGGGEPTTSRGEDAICREADAADFAPLGNNQAEVSQIAQLIGGKAMLGEEATETNFIKHAPESQILHLAMHGFLNDCDPLYSGLVFSRMHGVVGGNANNGKSGSDSAKEGADGFLHAYEIYNLKMNAELAVLSACNTGRGQLAKGEGVISLARAFKYAGCSNVLMSLWQADDQATAQIMQDFYRHLKEGLGKDAAIRQAKLDYLKSSNRNHPFFWGAFVLIGDDAALTPPPTAWGLWLLVGLGAVLLLFAAWYFFKKIKIVSEKR